MDPQAPVQPTNIPVQQPQKPFPIFLFLLASLVFLLLLSTSYFAYQNMQLQKQLTALQTAPSPTPSPIPSATLRASPSTTPNETQKCVDKNSLHCDSEPELSYECSAGYQTWATTHCPGWQVNTEGQFCGGIAGKDCPEGYTCKYDGNYPDAGGTCIKGIEQIPSISNAELEMGWYYGAKDQKKPNTPASWTYTEAGKDSCWHTPGTQCRFLPD